MERPYKTKNFVRMVTATSLFDGHDASINIIRQMLIDTGVEVIHLGHHRSVEEIVEAAICEDAQAVAISCYQGGHMEFFKYTYDMLNQKGASHIKIFGGGGGVIVPEEIKELEEYGITRIYDPNDGSKMGLQGMINDMVQKSDFLTPKKIDYALFKKGDTKTVARVISDIENAKYKKDTKKIDEIIKKCTHSKKTTTPIIGITGTGGAGKSSLTDELILRFTQNIKDIKIAIICCDPSRRKTGGALLGDRIRMNALDNKNIYLRSIAVRESNLGLSKALPEILETLKYSDFDLIIAETAGIGQGESKITDLVDISIYVMTSEFGAASQLEKIDMLDYADIVVINKFEKQGSEDALRDVRRQVQRNKKKIGVKAEKMEVYGTIASKFNDDGTTAFYQGLLYQIYKKTKVKFTKNAPEKTATKHSTSKTIIIPPKRIRYLSEIAETIRDYHKETEEQKEAIREVWHLKEAFNILKDPKIKNKITTKKKKIKQETKDILKQWEKNKELYQQDEFKYKVRDKEFRVPLYTESLSHNKIPKVALPKFTDPGEIYVWLRKENLPGFFPYTAGVFPFKRKDEDPTRMFAGEGSPERTNKRFKLLSENYPAKRLSTAFDSPTLYGFDPDPRPDIYGKVGNSGVSVCTIEDVNQLYKGFDLSATNTSVSMTINGPAPIMLAMFLNNAINEKIEEYKKENKNKIAKKEYEKIKASVLSNVRGTVQADILKEDQGQNTCIFSIDFALKMMGDIQEYFYKNAVKNFYSVSISGYHIAEAGANPISQLAFTLSNGFTFVEYYLSRNMPIDSFAPNLSFFFSAGMDPEYTVLGRVARRIWSIALKERYGANIRSQLLKYHIQTSGRSLHTQEIQFNDIRTTLQALCAIYDNCNSLHTNSYDEAITTPTEESVRRALAIQLIINREWGLNKNENISQGSFIMEELTDLVEEAVLKEFDHITARGGVLGAMEKGYQRSKIQEESMHYEHLKHSGEYPIVGVNSFLNPQASQEYDIELVRASDEEKESQLKRLENFHKKREKELKPALKKLQDVAKSGENIFAEMMETVKVASIGQISEALYEVGGRYRRGM